MTHSLEGTAALQGELWSTDPESWAAQDERQLPTYVAVADALAVAGGERVLEVGCSTGVFLDVAAARGASVTGLDAAAGLIEIARRRVPDAELEVGDLQRLPFSDASFDVVVGCNAFQFADDVVEALREAARVLRPGGRLAIQMWGRPERCELLVPLGALRPYLPLPPSGPPGGGNYSDPGVLERLVSEVGLAPESTGDVTYAVEYTNEDEFLRLALAAGLAVLAARLVGEETVRDALRTGAAGKLSFTNEWHWLVARKP
jgi:SAM-dependent methyltransferase